MMEEWKEYKLGDLITMSNGRKRPQEKGDFPVYGGNGIMDYADKYNSENVIVVGRVGAYCGCVYLCPNKCWVSDNAIALSPNNKVNIMYLYYLMSTLHLNHHHIGGAQPLMTQDIIGGINVNIPSLQTQRRIAAALSSFDAKIEVNRRINDNLEQQAAALFRSWFVDFEPFGGSMPSDWKIKSLSEIATYLNGLAMQKYPASSDNDALPVLKIRELGQGFCDINSDVCSRSSIGDEYFVNDGDVIFSWSGTLMVKIWVGGECGLNQHLFKVFSENYPKWLFYLWTKYHNDSFIRIAKDKAVTMGHIKRGELDKAKVFIPTNELLDKASALFNPIFEQYIRVHQESSRLASLRDTLLPKLMSGELKVNEINA